MNNIQRKTPPPVQLIDKVGFHLPEKIVLNNGIEAWCIQGGSHNIAKVEFVFGSGSFHQEKILQACAAVSLMRHGTCNKSSVKINEMLDFYGVSLHLETHKDIISVSLYCLSKHLDPVFDLLFEILAQPVFPEDELDIFLQKMKQKHLVNQEKINHLARVHFNELLFGKDHPYGAMINIMDFNQLNREDLVSFHRQHIHPGNCTCFLSGRFPDNFVQMINDKISKYSWNFHNGKLTREIEISRFSPGKHMIQKQDALQSSLRIGKRMIHRSHPDYLNISVTNTLLGGYFGSRLMRNIRQDKGYTYGIHSALVSLIKESYFFISSQVGVEVRELALSEVYLEIRQLRTKPADDKELALLRNYLSAGFLRLFDGPFMQIERFRELMLFGFDYSFYDSYLPAVNNLTGNMICETAEKYFHEDDMLELVVGQ
jgi:zinc protease